MHKVSIAQSVIDRVVARHGSEHVHADLDPAKTALVVVDMQNAFMMPGVAHAPCLTAQDIVPNINRLAVAVRQTGGAVVWIKTAYTDDTLQDWSTLYDMLGAKGTEKRAKALAGGSKGYELWETLDARLAELDCSIDLPPL
jgi:ureidoacrylate peracid hydrolase